MEALALPLVAARKSGGESAKGTDGGKAPSWPAHLGDLMYVEMRKRGWVQEELARHFGVAQSTVARWLDGSVKPTPKRVEQIAKFLDIDMPTAMRLNFKLGDEATEVASLSSRVAALEAWQAEMIEALTDVRNAQRVGNELVSQLLERVKSAREQRRKS